MTDPNPWSRTGPALPDPELVELALALAALTPEARAKACALAAEVDALVMEAPALAGPEVVKE